jgi:hypothetical protein
MAMDKMEMRCMKRSHECHGKTKTAERRFWTAGSAAPGFKPLESATAVPQWAE